MLSIGTKIDDLQTLHCYESEFLVNFADFGGNNQLLNEWR